MASDNGRRLPARKLTNKTHFQSPSDRDIDTSTVINEKYVSLSYATSLAGGEAKKPRQEY
jgi:hypothetical protein